MLKGFKEFVLRGNVVDMAIGVIIGAAFGKIITSLVTDVLMPPLGLILGRVNFSSLFVSLDGKHYPSLEAAKAAGAATVNYGVFINTIIDFLIVGFVMFVVITQFNRLMAMASAPAAPPAPATRDCPYCKSAIALAASRCPFCTSQL